MAARKFAFPEVDRETLQLTNDTRYKKLLVLGPFLMGAAKRFVAEEDTLFVGSRRWLRCFKKRSETSYKAQRGESVCVDAGSLDNWYADLPEI